MIGQFVEFKDYHINIQATYSLTEKIMHLNWLYSVFVEFKEYNKIYMLTYRKIILKNFDLSQKRIK